MIRTTRSMARPRPTAISAANHIVQPIHEANDHTQSRPNSVPKLITTAAEAEGT
ncbi:hypothetical protein [Actinomadura nitritigenes]|uniref:hypothetical protein n=1 Tax=Actinomadura nitritigenes TaxID=134602 RepID=UPI003D8FC401